MDSWIWSLTECIPLLVSCFSLNLSTPLLFQALSCGLSQSVHGQILVTVRLIKRGWRGCRRFKSRGTSWIWVWLFWIAFRVILFFSLMSSYIWNDSFRTVANTQTGTSFVFDILWGRTSLTKGRVSLVDHVLTFNKTFQTQTEWVSMLFHSAFSFHNRRKDCTVAANNTGFQEALIGVTLVPPTLWVPFGRAFPKPHIHPTEYDGPLLCLNDLPTKHAWNESPKGRTGVTMETCVACGSWGRLPNMTRHHCDKYCCPCVCRQLEFYWIVHQIHLVEPLMVQRDGYLFKNSGRLHPLLKRSCDKKGWWMTDMTRSNVNVKDFVVNPQPWDKKTQRQGEMLLRLKWDIPKRIYVLPL